MINDEDRYDAVIKISSLNSFRKSSKRVASADFMSQHEKHYKSDGSYNMSEIEKQIYNIVAKNQGVKAITIASKLHKTRKEINHYLYGSLRKYVRIGEEYKWFLK